MARDVTASVLAEFGKTEVAPVLLAEIEFSGGFTRVWNGIGDLVFGGETYTGIGDLGKVTPVGETTEVRAEGLTFELSGIPSSLISLALGQAQRNKSAVLWLGFMDANGALIADPFKIFSGRVDAAEIEEGGETATIRIAAESILADLQRSRERRYTHEDQKIDFPNDKGLEFVASLQDKQIIWGGQSTSSGGGGSVNRSRGTAGGRGAHRIALNR